MKPKIRIRQERPRVTKAPHHQRMWELFVYNPGMDEYEYHGFAGSLAEAIRLAHFIYNRRAFWRGGIIQEVTA